jgi:phosphatidate cytidylyltransferase
MLKQRVITALALMAILLPALWAEPLWPFALLSLAFIAAAGWEWSRLNGAPGWRAWALGVAVAGACLGLAQQWQLPVLQPMAPMNTVHQHVMGEALAGFVVPARLWWVALALWVLGGAAMLRWGGAFWSRILMPVRLLLGVLLLVMAWSALAEAKLQGLNFLLSIMCLVWVADIGAYFGGRSFGRRKLAPSISPGKSWEGVVAGALATSLLSVGWIQVERLISVDSPSLYSYLLMGLGPVGLMLSVWFLTAMSVVGDLFESLIKRQAGQKDSSALLPGHGGVLDRIDALLPVLPLALALTTLCHG